MSADDGRSPPSGEKGDDDAGPGPSPEPDTHAEVGDRDRRPAPAPSAGRGRGDLRELFEEFRTARTGPLMFLRETLVSVTVVALVGLLLFGASGVWPPMVAVQSGSMEPHMYRGDLVFVSEPGRYAPAAAHTGTGVVTLQNGTGAGHRSFGGYGSVVVYDDPTSAGAPVIHRAHLWVDAGENWYGRADPAYHRADSCAELPNCPAPHAGFVTKGDDNAVYDQVNGLSEPVRPDWIVGVAQVRLPYLGYVRLWLAEGVRDGGPERAVHPVGPLTDVDGPAGGGRVGVVTAGAAATTSPSPRRSGPGRTAVRSRRR